MSLSATLSTDGTELTLERYDGKHFLLVSARAFAPGQPLVVVVSLSPSLSLDLKSLGSRLRSDGLFEVRARAATLAKSTRERLLTALSAP